MVQFRFHHALVGGAIVIAIAMCISDSAAAEEAGGNQHGHHRSVYQRHAFEWKDRGRHDRGFRRSQRVPPKVESAWFQRPYPYHLDYYKMRYGGSCNLYGPPQVVTAPPYYGPYYGDFGYGGGMGNGPYPLSGEQLPGQPPVMPGGAMGEEVP
jgi:hypothetical protein